MNDFWLQHFGHFIASTFRKQRYRNETVLKLIVDISKFQFSCCLSPTAVQASFAFCRLIDPVNLFINIYGFLTLEQNTVFYSMSGVANRSETKSHISYCVIAKQPHHAHGRT